MVRRWYKQYRDQFPPTHPILRTRHFEKKLSSMTEVMVRSCDTRNSQAACALAEADDGISAIREAMALYDLQLNSATNGDVPWEKIRSKASEHFSNDCSVCLSPLIPGYDPSVYSTTHIDPTSVAISSMSSNHPTSQARPLSLLSCGHLLHEVCIEALERFASTSGECDGLGTFNTATQKLCPLCRTPYLRTPLEL